MKLISGGSIYEIWELIFYTIVVVFFLYIWKFFGIKMFKIYMSAGVNDDQNPSVEVNDNQNPNEGWSQLWSKSRWVPTTIRCLSLVNND